MRERERKMVEQGMDVAPIEPAPAPQSGRERQQMRAFQDARLIQEQLRRRRN